MATAPKPGAARSDKAIRIAVRGVGVIVRPGDFGPRDDALARRVTGEELGESTSLLGAFNQLDSRSIGLDSLCLLWWLARHKAGETAETFGEALDKFPSFGEADQVIEFEQIDGTDPGN